MAKPILTGSASLHFRIGAFGVLYTALVVSFTLAAAFALALVASVSLART